MHGITARAVNAVVLDEQFRNATAGFSLDLFRATISNSENSLISPTSVLLALAMTANGADGNTLSQMEQVLGAGITIDELNAYLFSFVQNLTSKPKALLNISNSIWFREVGFIPNHDFLQTNANYFDADAFAAPFNDQTVRDINNWISKATDGLIEKMLEFIPDSAIMYLINTILFDAEWARIYDEVSVRKGEFTNYNNQKQTAEFMHSEEDLFIQSENATGFIKPYYGGCYSFVAILPDKEINIFDYVATLSGVEFLNLVENAQPALVATALPKFDYEFEVTMNNALKAMGMQEAFCEITADFPHIGNGHGNLFISEVLHKAYITVDERGTKAGAATVVGMDTTSVPPPPQHYVILDRPFVYAIIDNATNLPLFVGTLLSIQSPFGEIY
jgi:serpin B